MFSIPHWSYSSISQYLKCPLQYYFERVLKLPKPTTSSSLIFGGCFHEVLREYHTTLSWGDPWELDELGDLLEHEWDTRTQDINVKYGKNETAEDLLALGKAFLQLYLEQPKPTGIDYIEQPALAPLFNSRGECLAKPLMAIFDLMLLNNGQYSIKEFKTSGQSYSQSQVDTSLQATCYLHLSRELFVEPTDLEFLVFVKTKTPKLQRISTTRTEADFKRLGDVVEMVDRAITAGIYFPVESPMNCSTCPYQVPCKEWGTSTTNGPADLVQLTREINHVD